MVIHKKCSWQSPTWIAWFWNYIDSKRDGIDVKFGTDERDSERTTFEEQTTDRWPYLWEIQCLRGDVGNLRRNLTGRGEKVLKKLTVVYISKIA